MKKSRGTLFTVTLNIGIGGIVELGFHDRWMAKLFVKWTLVSEAFEVWRRMSEVGKSLHGSETALERRLSALTEKTWRRYLRRALMLRFHQLNPDNSGDESPGRNESEI